MKKLFAMSCLFFVSCTTYTDIYMKDSTIKTDTAVSNPAPVIYAGPPTYFPSYGPVWGPGWGGGWGGSPSVIIGGGGWGGGCW